MTTTPTSVTAATVSVANAVFNVIAPQGGQNNGSAAVNAIVVANGIIYAPNMPTADPHRAGVFWANAGILTVSAG